MEEELNLENINERTTQIELISEYILNQKKAFTMDKALSSSKIFEEYQHLLNNKDLSLPQIPQNTFNIYISKVSSSANNRINCQGRKKGYYIDKILEKIEKNEEITREKETENIEQEKKEQKQIKVKGNLLEKDLYPFLEQWLFQVDNERVSDISSNRSQGKWANPDLVGLKIDNLFGATEVEITTIEAKLTLENWEQWIFEAVAHTIFSNRSYFAFIRAENHINKIEPELKHYAETFKVGLLIIAVDPKDYIKIQQREKFELTDENHKIIEYSPAPFSIPHTKFKKKFLNGLGIKEPRDLYRFGKALEH